MTGDDAEGMKAQNLTKFLNSHPRVTVDWIEPLVHLEKTWNSQNIMIIAMTNIRVIVVELIINQLLICRIENMPKQYLKLSVVDVQIIQISKFSTSICKSTFFALAFSTRSWCSFKVLTWPQWVDASQTNHKYEKSIFFKNTIGFVAITWRPRSKA